MNSRTPTRSIYLLLWFLCLLGSLALVPYLRHLALLPQGVPLSKIILAMGVQSAIFNGVICGLCAWIVPKCDLQPFRIERPLKEIIWPALWVGTAVAMLISFLNGTFFHKSILSQTHPPAWAGLLASLYGGINEEVLARLFLLSLVYLILNKIAKNKPRLLMLWIANAIVALIFGASHLPAALKLEAPSSLEVTRILLLNAIPSLAFGWLYWSRSLWATMAAHFVADLFIHVLLVLPGPK